MKYDVFISYSRRDYVKDGKAHAEHLPGNIIDKLLDIFRKEGINPWIDKEGIYSGDAFAKVISQAIAGAPIFLFISSINSNRPDCWTADEVALARNKKKFIIPFLIDDTPYNDDFALFIAKLDYIDYPEEGEPAFAKLVNSINKKLDELDPNRKTIRELKEKQAKLRQEIKQKESEWNTLVSRLAEFGEKAVVDSPFDSGQAEKFKKEKEALERTIAEISKEKADLEAKCKDLEAKTKELVSLKEFKSQAEIKIKQLEEKDRKSQETINDINSTVSRLQTENKTLTETVSTLKTENSRLKADIDKLRKEAEKLKPAPAVTPTTTFRPKSKNLTVEDFFPIYNGMKLGMTGEALQWLGYRKYDIPQNDFVTFYTDNGSKLVDYGRKNKFNDFNIEKSYNMPNKWAALGFDWSLSYDAWVHFFNNNGFSIEHTEAPHTVVYIGRKTLNAEFYATSNDKRFRFHLYFKFGNQHNEGYSTSSRNSLFCINAELLS